jgi:hypothetical protein
MAVVSVNTALWLYTGGNLRVLPAPEAVQLLTSVARHAMVDESPAFTVEGVAEKLTFAAGASMGKNTITNENINLFTRISSSLKLEGGTILRSESLSSRGRLLARYMPESFFSR